ncbi:MAG: hypothetical protein AB7Q23_16395 [Hyphomonadaceae bacterium]
MRALIALAALGLAAWGLAACDAAGDLAGGPGGGDGAGGYSVEIRALQSAQTYIVTAPDGRVVAARAAEGASALLDAAATRALGVAETASAPDAPEVFALRFPGVDVSIAADETSPDSASARVAINAGGHSVLVNANEGGPGDADDHANVRITGMSEADVREFIAKADELSPSVQARMLADLGLE